MGKTYKKKIGAQPWFGARKILNFRSSKMPIIDLELIAEANDFSQQENIEFEVT